MNRKGVEPDQMPRPAVVFKRGFDVQENKQKITKVISH